MTTTATATRIRFIRHQEAEILHIDFSHTEPEQLLALVEEASRIIQSKPPKSVLTLTDVTEARYNRQVTKLVRDYAGKNGPHVLAAAVVGATGLRRIILDGVRLATGRKLATFDTVEEAKAYLLRHAADSKPA